VKDRDATPGETGKKFPETDKESLEEEWNGLFGG
jgi:hypothetical protein